MWSPGLLGACDTLLWTDLGNQAKWIYYDHEYILNRVRIFAVDLAFDNQNRSTIECCKYQQGRIASWLHTVELRYLKKAWYTHICIGGPCRQTVGVEIDPVSLP
jgi:hypothetical protein